MKQCDFDLQYELSNSKNPTNKHAYLIMAHNEPEVLSTLIRLLDDPRNDIFLHIDSKSDIDKFSFNCTKSHLYLVPRISVLWGGFLFDTMRIVIVLFRKGQRTICRVSFDFRS